MGEEIINFNIPLDSDGFVLLKCPKCGEIFKIIGQYLNEYGMDNIFCPACGLKSDKYYTDDIAELIQTKINNKAKKLIYKEFKKMEHKFNNSIIKFNINKPKYECENTVLTRTDDMQKAKEKCCNKEIKINKLLEFSGYYCPYCGEYQNE